MAVVSSTSFVIADRTITLPLNIDTFGVVGDSNSKVVEFRTDRFADGIDLSEKQIFVCYKNATTETGETECVDIKFTSTTLTFNWVVPAEVVTTVGTIEFYVEFRTTDSEGNVTYRLKTKPISQFVEDSFYIYNNVVEPDTSILDSWLSTNSERIDRKDLVDADLPFKVADRDILFNTEKIVAVENDNLSQALTFRMKRIVDNIDRKNFTFAFAFKNANGKTGFAPACNIMSTEDEIFISWAIENLVTQVSGKVEFFILALGTLEDDKKYRWNTKPSSFIVETTLQIENDLEVPSEKWYDSLLLEVDNAVKQASTYANDVKDVYSNTSAISLVANDTLVSCREAELNAQNYANEAKEAFASMKNITISRSDKAQNGIFLTVEYKRNDQTLYAKSVLVPDAVNVGRYTGLVVQLYGSNGITVISEETLPVIYDDDGNITGNFTLTNYLGYHVDTFSKAETSTLKSEISAISQLLTGTVVTYMGTTAPTGYLECDGKEYYVVDYPALAQHIETQFGSKTYFGGDDLYGTFAVPAIEETIECLIRCIKY